MSTTPTNPISPICLTLSSDSNYAVAKSRLDVIVKALVDNFAKWILAQKQGMLLCRSVEAIKTKTLEAGTDVYRNSENLKLYCNKLAIVTSIFADIIENVRVSLCHLYALSKLKGIDNEIFYRSWHFPHFIEFVQTLLECYEQELIVKQCVMRNLAHCTSRAELITCISQWEYPQHVDDWTKLNIVLFTEEIKSNK